MLIPPSVTGVASGWDERYEERLRAELETVADRLRGQGKTVEVDLRYGDAAEEIVAASAECDLIVMTTHGRGAAGRLVFGSTADRVSRHGTIPTLLLRRGAHPIEAPHPNRVVVPLDGSDLAEQALPEAEKLARTLDVPVLLVRAVSSDDVLATARATFGNVRQDPGGTVEDDTYKHARIETERLATEYLEEKAANLATAGLTTAIEMLKGTPAFVLLWKVNAGDVVVMTSHGRGGYRRWMIGSVAEKLVREAAGPVLLVRGAI